ncbi:MAG: transposase [Bryobacteraceae bacterium]
MPSYLITLTTYGHHIPGQPGTVNRHHNHFGSRLPHPNPRLRQSIDRRLLQAPFELDPADRQIVLEAITAVCEHKKWHLSAVHIRTNHVQIVTDGAASPEFMMNAFKSYASRALNAKYPAHSSRLRWARHGSTRHLFTREALENAIKYTLDAQGERMAIYEHLTAP